MTVIEEHKCQENKDRYGNEWNDKIFKDKLDEWNIEAGNGYHNVHDITYCPFCGVKL